MYHHATYKPSKNFAEPVRTPSISAKAGRNAAAAHHAKNPTRSPASNKRMPAPDPVSAVTRNPAAKHAGSWRSKMRAEEKSSGRVPNRSSRAPMADQIRTGQSHVAVRAIPREADRGVTNCAINNPSAMTYHHQR